MGLVDAATLTLVLVIVTALAFDFTNGFHDTGNAMATSIATGALKPKMAVALSAVLNLVGAFLSVEVALTITNAVVNLQDESGAPKAELLADGGQALLLIILAGLVGGIVWNLFTWLYGLPSSSSHALLGGLVGSTMAGLGFGGVKWTGDGTKLDGVVGKILLPCRSSPRSSPSSSPRSAPGSSSGSPAVSPSAISSTASGSVRWARPLSCPWPTARTTPRRRWAS